MVGYPLNNEIHVPYRENQFLYKSLHYPSKQDEYTAHLIVYMQNSTLNNEIHVNM
jgi:hypothetical protein